MKFLRILLALLFCFTSSEAQLNQFSGTVTSVNNQSRTLVVRTNQGRRNVELRSGTQITLNGRHARLNQLRSGEQVSVDGIVLSDGNTVANSIIGYGQGSNTFEVEPSVQPAPNAQTGNTRPQVRAVFAESLKKAQVWVDGTEFTAQAQVSGNTVSWTPNYDLDYGTHRIRIVGHTSGLVSTKEDADWQFTISRGAQSWPDTHSDQLLPSPGSTVGTRRPTIGAIFPENVRQVRLLVDGRDETSKLGIWGNRATWTPSYNLDSRTHSVTISATGQSGRRHRQSWNFTIPNWTPNPGNNNPSQPVYAPAAHLADYGPAPGSVVTVTQPTISCRFSANVKRSSIRMSVDGHDVTPSAQKSNNKVSWRPGYNLDFGQHIVRVKAIDQNGKTVRGNWNFVIAR